MEYYVQLIRAYAYKMEYILDDVAKKSCYGCEVDHPSQLQHDVCVMMDLYERVGYCLDRCVVEIDENEVMSNFTDSLDIREVLRCPSILYNVNHRQTFWGVQSWREDIIREIIFRKTEKI